MALVKWAPMRELEDFNRFFEFPSFRGMTRPLPAADIYEDADTVYAEIELPGVLDSKAIHVSVENDVLSIDVREERKKEIDERNYSLRERQSYVEHRSFQLPNAVNGNEAKAVYEKGILKVSIPKREEVKQKSIKVEVKE